MVTLLIQHISVYFLRPLLDLLDLLKTKKGTTCWSAKNVENAHLADTFRLQAFEESFSVSVTGVTADPSATPSHTASSPS